MTRFDPQHTDASWWGVATANPIALPTLTAATLAADGIPVRLGHPADVFTKGTPAMTPDKDSPAPIVTDADLAKMRRLFPAEGTPAALFGPEDGTPAPDAMSLFAAGDSRAEGGCGVSHHFSRSFGSSSSKYREIAASAILARDGWSGCSFPNFIIRLYVAARIATFNCRIASLACFAMTADSRRVVDIL